MLSSHVVPYSLVLAQYLTKRRSAKRRSAKRRSAKRRSRFGDDGDDGVDGGDQTNLLEIIKIIANSPKKKYDENAEEPLPKKVPRNSIRGKYGVEMAEEAFDKAKAEAAEAKAKAEYPPEPPPLPPVERLSTWELNPKIPKAEAEAEAAAAAKADEAPRRTSYKWPTPGKRGPAPPPTVGFNKQVPADGSSLSKERAQKFKEGVQDGVLKLLKRINDLGGKAKFGQLFTEYENVSDSLNGYLMIAKKDFLIDYDGEMLLHPMNQNVVINLTDKGKEMLIKSS